MSIDAARSGAEPHRRLARWLASSGCWAIVLAALCTLLALVGWAFGIDVLARFLPAWPVSRPVSQLLITATAGAFALLLSQQPRRRLVGRLLLALASFGVTAATFLPQAATLPGGPLQLYAASAFFLLLIGIALVTATGTRQINAARMLAAMSAALLFVAAIGISFRLLLALPPLVSVSLPAILGMLLLAYAVVAVRPDARLLARLTAERPGAVITRRVFPAALVLPLLIGWFAVAAEGGGIIDSAFGAVLQTVATMIALGALVLWGARRLDRMDARRDEAERALRRAYSELDRRVEARTAELERLMAAEQRLRVDAERANRAKDEFLAIVSHELRSPLNALRGWGFLLGSAKAPDADLIERATQAIKRNVDHQSRLIEDLLDTSRIMSGKLNIERRPVDLMDILMPAVDSVRQAAAAKRITVVYDKKGQPIPIEGDAARLHQIAVNLLTNAIKFTPEGGEVYVGVERDEGVARLSVRDTGAGIAPEFLPRVFDRFTQADTSTTRRHGGLGIGLALVRHLVELHRGKVSACSEGVGKGSTFTVELPLAAPLEPDANASSADAGTGGLAGMSICALDDDPDARDVISLTLTQAGAQVRTVASGAELIALLDQALPARRPDVLLMDLAMPDEDGFTVLARVRALERGKAVPEDAWVPAIAVTAFTEVSRERVLEQGFIDHVAKPIDPERLIASIRRVVARTPPAVSLSPAVGMPIA